MADERDELDSALKHYECEYHKPDDPSDDCVVCDGYQEARSIRARERKLAELAHEARRYYGVFARRAKVWGRDPAPDVQDWLNRYEEAVK